MRLYWLRRSIPELADLPKEARRRVYLNALERSPRLTVAFGLLVGCLFAAIYIPAWLLIPPDTIDVDVRWADVVIGGVCCLVTLALTWIIVVPVVFHFLRPHLRRAREADEGQRGSTH